MFVYTSHVCIVITSGIFLWRISAEKPRGFEELIRFLQSTRELKAEALAFGEAGNTAGGVVGRVLGIGDAKQGAWCFSLVSLNTNLKKPQE